MNKNGNILLIISIVLITIGCTSLLVTNFKHKAYNNVDTKNIIKSTKDEEKTNIEDIINKTEKNNNKEDALKILSSYGIDTSTIKYKEKTEDGLFVFEESEYKTYYVDTVKGTYSIKTHMALNR